MIFSTYIGLAKKHNNMVWYTLLAVLRDCVIVTGHGHVPLSPDDESRLLYGYHTL